MRTRALAVMILVTTLFLGACSTSGNTADNGQQPTVFSMDVAQEGDRLYRELDYRDRLEELAPSVVYTLLGIEEGDVLELKNYFSSGATAEEILVIKAKDQDALARLRFLIDTRVQDQMDIYVSYAPEEVEYLKAAVIDSKEDYLVYCVSSSPDKAGELVKDMFAQEVSH